MHVTKSLESIYLRSHSQRHTSAINDVGKLPHTLCFASLFFFLSAIVYLMSMWRNFVITMNKDHVRYFRTSKIAAILVGDGGVRLPRNVQYNFIIILGYYVLLHKQSAYTHPPPAESR